MNYKIVIEPRAIQDIQEAMEYYESKKTGLSDYFFETLEEHISTLECNPFFEVKYKDYHGLPIKKFPFILFYYIDKKKKTVFIISVFNTSQNPIKYPK